MKTLADLELENTCLKKELEKQKTEYREMNDIWKITVNDCMITINQLKIELGIPPERTLYICR